MEGLWNKAGNGVVSLQACWPRQSRSDDLNISVQTHAAEKQTGETEVWRQKSEDLQSFKLIQITEIW